MQLNKILNKIQELESEVNPEQKMEIRFTMNKDSIDESLSNVHWVLLDLGVPDGHNIQT
jgi:hypothetical protein